MADVERGRAHATEGKRCSTAGGIFCHPLIRITLLFALLYIFVCSLSLMGSAFQLLGGKEAGRSLSKSDVFSNPVAGLVMGVLATVLVQSSSTSTSIIITMVAAKLLTIKHGIFMIMGANIGTSVTNTIVALTQMKDRSQFELSFSGATVHDMFNFLSVLILFPIEAISGALYHLTSEIIDSWSLSKDKDSKIDLLKKLTHPLTSKFVLIDKKQIAKIARGNATASQTTLLKQYCGKKTVQPMDCESNEDSLVGWDGNISDNISWSAREAFGISLPANIKSKEGNDVEMNTNCTKIVQTPCDYIFYNTGLPESLVGGILLLVSLVFLCTSLILIVKILTSLLQGKVAKGIKTFVNADFPGPARHLTGYVAILVGASLTVLVQSSSVFTSALTPLVGLKVITLERMYPLTLGSNIGTTVTGILAALASSRIQLSMQVALAHLFFNIFGIIIWYPIPKMRALPLAAARYLGQTTAKYRWFAIAYIIIVFFLIPAAIFALSLAGWKVLLAVMMIILTVILFIVVVNVLQKRAPNCLPSCLQSWDCLPLWMHSLQPLDRLLSLALCCKSSSSEPSARHEKEKDTTELQATTVDSNKAEVITNTGYLDDCSELETNCIEVEGPAGVNKPLPSTRGCVNSNRISQSDLWVEDPEQFVVMQTDF